MPDFDYSRAFHPPAPALPVQIGRTSSESHEIILALLDTGSDMTSIPPAVVRRLDMVQVDSIRVRRFIDGARREELAAVFQAQDYSATMPSPLKQSWYYRSRLSLLYSVLWFVPS